MRVGGGEVAATFLYRTLPCYLRRRLGRVLPSLTRTFPRVELVNRLFDYYSVHRPVNRSAALNFVNTQSNS